MNKKTRSWRADRPIDLDFFKDEGLSIVSQILLWLPAGFAVSILYWAGKISDATVVSHQLQSLLKEVLSTYAILWVVISCLIAFIIALACGATNLCRILNEECWRAFYAAGAFILVFVGSFNLTHATTVLSFTSALGLFAISCVAGMGGSFVMSLAICWREQLSPHGDGGSAA